jgi:hypothetical protein
MRGSLAVLAIGLVVLAHAATASAQEFGQGQRQNLMKVETGDLPQGRVVIGGGERVHPPGGRTPWHTSGPKVFYVLDGTMSIEGLGPQTLQTCGPAPKLCFSPHTMWFIRNAGPGPLKFVIIGIDAADKPTIHEEVGQVTGISGDRVTIAVGDLRTSDLVVPRREVTMTVRAPVSFAVGDDVVTVRYEQKGQRAEALVKLSQRWR